MVDEKNVKELALSELGGIDLSVLARSHPGAFFDARIKQYVSAVMANPNAHNAYEIFAIVRFARMLDMFVFDVNRARRFFLFFECLDISGTDGRNRAVLTPVEAFFFANIYGFVTGDGRRIIRTVYLFVPRKFGKTEIAATMAIYDFLFGDKNSQSFVASNSYDQSQICFSEIQAIMSKCFSRRNKFRINRESIFPLDKSDSRFIRCLSASPKTKDGFNASLAIIDEYAQARDSKLSAGSALKNTLVTSMMARPEPLTVVITTASDVTDGPFARELEGVMRVLRGELEDWSLFALLFMPDKGDAEDDPKTWAKVQPHLGITVQPDAYAAEWKRAQLSADNMMSFRTKLLNIFAKSAECTWIDSRTAAAAERPFLVGASAERPDAMCAIDLSERYDMTAVSVAYYARDERSFYFRTDYFLPEGGVSGHPNEALYRSWQRQGFLHVLPGDVIDYRMIVDHVIRLNDFVRILQIGYDAWRSQEVVNMLAAAGARDVLTPVKQTYGNFTAPVDSFEHGLRAGHVFLEPNPIMEWNFDNAVMDFDSLENKKPIKRSENQKIDGVITMLMCMRLFIDYVR